MHLRSSQPSKGNLNYGIIGNCKSSALINEDSSIEWCCLPQFDSASVFGKILDDEIGGLSGSNATILIKFLKNTLIKQPFY